MGKGRQAIGKVGKEQELCKAGIITTKDLALSYCTVLMAQGQCRSKIAGGGCSRIAGLRQQTGKQKATDSGSRRNRQFSGSRPRKIRQQASMTPQGNQYWAHRSLVVDAFFYPLILPVQHSWTLESHAVPVGMQDLSKTCLGFFIC